MLERRRRSQMRLDPLLPIPTGTTTMRRTRRVCVNIEANGSGPLRSRRRRRRELLNTFFMTYPPAYDPMQLGHPWGFNFCPNELPNAYGNLFDFPDRLNAGEQYEYDTPPTETGPQTVHELKDIFMGLDNYLQAEKIKLMENNQERPISSENHEDEKLIPKESQLSVLTDIMCETIDRLNNYLANQSQKQECPSALNQINPLGGRIPPVQVLQLPVQPMILQSLPPCPPCNYFAPSESCLQKKSSDRLPWLKERKRKRPSKPAAYIHLQNQGSSTDDLEMLPKILESSNSAGKTEKFSVPLHSQSQVMKDAGTTMCCSMECCRESCGTLRSREHLPPTSMQRTLPKAPILPFSLLTTVGYPPPCVKAPPPSIKSEDDLDDQERFYNPTGESIGSPQASSYSSSCDYRHQGGNLRYSYIEEEEEQVDEDDWYQSASNKLAELEVEQDYFQLMQKQRQITSKDLESTSENSFINVIATTDKALSTTELNTQNAREPMQIERVCKKSSMKQPLGLINGSQKRNIAGHHKVMFEKVKQTEGVQAQPEMRTIGTDPIRNESLSTIFTDQKVLKPRSKSTQKRSVRRKSGTIY
ncbi:LOW QUALITY PROTEIN: uncharacterized protein LOC128261636 [Drosophila gunungcola]|uniref:LOW QUALITY PROTEIN: uncharacterized protein LOC128261636 n=1 Tax=Drosophila gunungcola TaxID=103775 RepID=UPI0022DFA7EA|nr:LOW QUALITY PROTEIN: uncharacterized protein LOC128261636 [Drosophila gunungcola]